MYGRILKQNQFHLHWECEIELQVYHSQSIFPMPN